MKQVCFGEWGGLGQLKQPAIAVAGLGRFVLLEVLRGRLWVIVSEYALGSGMCTLGVEMFWECGWF